MHPARRFLVLLHTTLRLGLLCAPAAAICAIAGNTTFAAPHAPATGQGAAERADLGDEEIEVLAFTAPWRWLDTGIDPGPQWITRDFDDGAWPVGRGLIGYDTASRRDRWPEPGLQSEVEPGRLTYLFRTEFDYDGPLQGIRLHIDQIIDDAAVIFLNGREIGRSAGAPEGDATFDTPATVTVGIPSIELNAHEVRDPPLARGRNVLAVSLHNRSAASSDICLGLRVRISTLPVPPRAMYLSWQRDPTTTMTIQWHGESDEHGAEIEIAPLDAGNEALSKRIRPTSTPMVFTGRTIYTAEATDLTPDRTYRFRIIHPGDRRISEWYHFRTMPDRIDRDDRPLRLVFGGDVRHRKSWMEAMNRQAARFNPDAIIWGGDLAYADGLERNLSRWDEFFDACMNTLVLPDRRVIPIIVGIGNHEIRDHFYWGEDRGRSGYEDSDDFRSSIAPYFYNLFAFPGHPGYGVLDIGDDISIVVLDTDHSGPIEGTQTDWLRDRLAERAHVTHIIPVYHYPAFPSVRNFDGAIPARIRTHWIPLFEAAGVRVAFEHHDHAYKRTVPIRDGRADPDGITYVGDGAWGVGLRQPRDATDTWYLERALAAHHMILMTITGAHLDLKVIDMDGHLLDHFVIRAECLADFREQCPPLRLPGLRRPHCCGRRPVGYTCSSTIHMVCSFHQTRGSGLSLTHRRRREK